MKARCIRDNIVNFKLPITVGKVYVVNKVHPCFQADSMIDIINDNGMHESYNVYYFELIEDKIYSPIDGDIVG